MTAAKTTRKRKPKPKPAVAAAPRTFESRIVGSDDVDPTQLLANPLNWRVHPGRQRDAMRGSLREVGWVQQVVVNTTTGHVLDGHMRVEEAISASEPTVPVLYVELTEEEERVVLATLDPLGEMAGQSNERLAELLKDVSVSEGALSALMAKMQQSSGEAYSGKISVPRYEPTGDKPEPSALYDAEKYDELSQAIDAADLPPDVAAFLSLAASRHIVFDYGAIAEWYAHQDAPVQRLVEASALVIIDYEDAIRDGYVQFRGAIESLREEDAALGYDADD